ncbi:hypothetical protein Geob_1187 [Geotalea daltonii FRC-32]|uniref:Uncharacterized protein n=1 Tax=Geotalea daltonii (strain DSM 22248 / JCM 15807 / FRC-32) TaxID=316067 RepID=B9M3D7_GEODF|nr:hypothetical protein [Geotalea daltonii]ACM19547.1 hypothetical protein Geob_1187 [Geotalea daltonii FRC-32]
MTKFIVAASVAWILIAAAGVCPADETLPETAGCPPLSLAPLALPPGVETNPYSYRISTYGGQQPIKIFFASGAFPPGLVMSPAGEITGVPKISGTFEFNLVADDSCPTGSQRVSRSLKLVIISGTGQQVQASVIRQQQLKLKVTAIPAATALAGIKPTEQVVTYEIAAQPPETATLHSPGGTFSVAGSVVESVPAPLAIAIINGRAKVSEKVTVSARVLERARREKSKIIYSRPFSGRQTTELAMVDFTLE